EDVLGRHQLRRAVPGNEEATGIGRVAHADMAERVDDALMGEDAVGERKLLADGGQAVGHWTLLGLMGREWTGAGVLFYTNGVDLNAANGLAGGRGTPSRVK